MKRKKTPIALDDNKTKKKGRGITTLPLLLEMNDKGIRPPISFDYLFNPVGEYKSWWSSYLGLLARTKIDIISKPNWKSVDAMAKQKLWKALVLAFDIDHEDIPTLREKCISRMGERWRDFKSKLTRDYVHGKYKTCNPTIKHTFISESSWRAFHAKKLEEEASVSGTNSIFIIIIV